MQARFRDGRIVIFWWKARLVTSVLVPSLAAFFVVTAATYQWSAAFPSLTGGNGTVRFLTFVPLIVVSPLHHCLTQRLEAAELLSLRPIRRHDAALVVTTVALCTVAGLAIGTLAGDDAARAVGRNVAFLTGLMLMVNALLPKAAAGVPVAWVLIALFLGRDAFHRPYFWSVLEHRAASPLALAEAMLCFACGLAVHLRQRPRTM